MNYCVSIILLLVLIVSTNAAFTKRSIVNPETGEMKFVIKNCNSSGLCSREDVSLIPEDLWRGCSDPITCSIIPSEEDYSAWGTFNTESSITFNYQPRHGGGAYMTRGNGINEYRMFYLLNKELSFDIDLSTVGCGLNTALYFSAMPRDGGMSLGYKGPIYGTGYCDAQAAVPPYRPTCPEMDIWEANSLSTVYTTHGCNLDSTYCDPAGCGFNPYQLGEKLFYGRSIRHAIDTTKPFTVVTRFVTVDASDDGDLEEIQRFYIQNGKIIRNPTVEGFSSISDKFCNYFGKPNADGVSDGMSRGLRQGMVLLMTFWGDLQDSAMTWLDVEPNGPCPAYNNSAASVTFSNIKFGPIGSTVYSLED